MNIGELDETELQIWWTMFEATCVHSGPGGAIRDAEIAVMDYRNNANLEPPTIPEGSVGMELYELAPGVRGYAIEHDEKIYIPVIISVEPRRGNVGRFLDRLSKRVRIPTIINPELITMLQRRGWVADIEEHHGERSEVWRKP